MPAGIVPLRPSERSFVGLRRAEAAGLAVEHLQQREEHWVVADLTGKGGHVRTVPVPTWVKLAVDNWLTAAGIWAGPVFRAIDKARHVGWLASRKVTNECTLNCAGKLKMEILDNTRNSRIEGSMQ
jgi:integrase